MTDAVSIKRRNSKDDNNSYESLRREGIDAIQRLSGLRWTDYNPHDPGITILEQLCYALTDLIYRAGFDVEDCLVDENGRIDYERLALFSPEQIYPSRATTEQDYRKVILDVVMEIDNVWISHASAGRGLYRIAVRLCEPLALEQYGVVIEKVRCAYLQQRNLSEDVQEIVIMREVDCSLNAAIEVKRGRSAAEIMAEIYYRCSKYIGGCITPGSYDLLLQKGLTLDELFCGPWTHHGYIDDQDLDGDHGELLVSSLFEIINGIEGVDHIKSLYLNYDRELYSKTETHQIPQATLRLHLPTTNAEMGIRLSESRMSISVVLSDLCDRYQELTHQHKIARSRVYSSGEVVKAPQGAFRNIADYYSIQNHFPNVYGVNRYGVPESAGSDVKAKVLQLKGYLLLFEQLMANSMANFSSVGDLFSLNSGEHSYSSTLLNETVIRDVGKIYPDNPSEIIADLISCYDNSVERKSRVLDYLLALYGERLTLDALRHFNHYYSDDELCQYIVSSKIDYLRHIIKIGRDRGAGIDYTLDMWDDVNNVSGLQQRASRQLGFKLHHPRLLTAPFSTQNIALVSHDYYLALNKDNDGYRLVNINNLHVPYKIVPVVNIDKNISLTALYNQLRDVVPLQTGMISELLLHVGVNINQYRLINRNDCQKIDAFVVIDNGSTGWYMGTYTDTESAIHSINNFQQFILRLNIESEGIYLLEHVLLMPTSTQSASTLEWKEQGFYDFRISILLPAWTLRSRDKHFRHLAELTLRESCPAHVYPEFYWLEFDALGEFERIYEKWGYLKRRQAADPKACDELAIDLTSFLVQHRV